MERKQITRVDVFLDNLNKTVLSELRSVRTQYEQIWQSTVLALDAQREQSERQIVALTSRLNILADEVVFQKRMAILQSVLLLSCLVLVIFSRGAGNTNNSLSAAMMDSFPTTFPPSQQTSPYSRRYGYTTTTTTTTTTATNRPDSPTEILSSMPGSPPGSSGADDRLAASALPRRLYSASFKDKSLPLTPPSEHSRESTPAASHTSNRDLNPSPETSFYSREGDRKERREEEEEEEQEEKEAEAEGEVTPSRLQISGSHTAMSVSGSGSDTVEEISSIEVVDPSPSAEMASRNPQGIEAEEDGIRRENPPSSLRARSAMSHVGGVRKPLPALPEDPS
jgi:hypothetical protein